MSFYSVSSSYPISTSPSTATSVTQDGRRGRELESMVRPVTPFVFGPLVGSFEAVPKYRISTPLLLRPSQPETSGNLASLQITFIYGTFVHPWFIGLLSNLVLPAPQKRVDTLLFSRTSRRRNRYLT